MTGRTDPAVWRIACVAAAGSFMAQLDATVVNVSLSSLAHDLHASLALIQWVTSGYLLALALMLPLNGWLVDRVGARALYLWCLTAFTVSSALCGLAWSAGSLIGFRVLQGMSGGLLAPMAQMLLARSAGGRMAQVVAVAALPVLLAPLLGPVLAGEILRLASWRWLFLVNLPAGALALALAFAFLPDDRAEARPRRLDFAGLALLSPGLALFLYGIGRAGELAGALALAASVASLALFWRRARRIGGRGLVDPRLLRIKGFPASVVAAFMMNGVAFAGQMLVPAYLVRGCGASPEAAGRLMAPLGLGMMCVYPFMGLLTRRFGVRRLAGAGALAALAGTLPFLVLGGAGMSPAATSAALFVRGAGLGAVGIPAITAGYAAVARRDLPMATGAMNIVQRLGGPTLTTLCATALGWRLAAAPADEAAPGAFATAFGLLCALHLLLFAAALRLPWSAAPARGDVPGQAPAEADAPG